MLASHEYLFFGLDAGPDEAMTTPSSPNLEATTQLRPPQPHLPLRRASTQRLHSHRSGPRPFFTPQHHQLRGFNPSPVVEPLPHIDHITASSEHAFAGRDERGKRPFRPPLDVQTLQHGQEQRRRRVDRSAPNSAVEQRQPPSSPMVSPHPDSPQETWRKLRSSQSLGDGLRGWRHRLSVKQQGSVPSPPLSGRGTPDTFATGNGTSAGEVRASMRSALTSHSSFMNTSSVNTDQSSVWTENSSSSDFVHIYPKWPDTDEPRTSFDVEDAIGMYEDGFESNRESNRNSMDLGSKQSAPDDRPASARQPQKQARPLHRRSQSASLLDRVKQASNGPGELSMPTPRSERGPPVPEKDQPTSRAVAVPPAVPRDRYGFKKASHYITVQQYDAWDRVYSVHMDRRRNKWQHMMKSYGLSTDRPIRFPPKSDKVKRYVRKGIPPEWRGAAWFWYAGGPGILKKQPGLYLGLLDQVSKGRLSDNDREHIERDLNRTFPDNVRFKPDPTTMLDAQAGAGGGIARPVTSKEEPIVCSLRRVLQAFAVHSPSIGYCQSLNFIAGLLLLFLNQDEERTFVLLNLVTSVHLPGTHGVTLEGANVDIAVMMACVKDALPAVWAKLDDKGGGPGLSPAAQSLRLPTVSLATTAWFMSLFVGTLPIESVLRVWDCLFFEGSKTLFRIALAIFKAGEREILAVSDPMEIFQVVQTIPRGMLDVNGLLDVCFRRRGGFGHVSQDMIERRREERRRDVKTGIADGESGLRRMRSRWRSKTNRA